MKNLIKPAAFAVAIILLAISANASVLPYSKFSVIANRTVSDSKFSIAINQLGSDEVISAVIDNPERKNLFVSLVGPDGATIDNFYTGRRNVKMNKTYNFTGADEGLYTLVISDGKQRIKKQVKLERVVAQPVSRLTVE